MADHSPVIRKALLFVRTGEVRSLDGLTPWALEDELMGYAKREARGDECEAVALTRLTREDEVAKALARAAHHADIHQQQTRTADERLEAFRKHFGLDHLSKQAKPAAGSREQIADVMDAVARREARPGEDFYSAYDRLINTDDEFRKAYDAYNRAKE